MARGYWTTKNIIQNEDKIVNWHDVVLRVEPRSEVEYQVLRQVQKHHQDILRVLIGTHVEQDDSTIQAVVYKWRPSSFKTIVM